MDEPPTARQLELMADYLIMCMEKQERKERKILTENRMSTVNKRETSFEGLVSQFENGEDGVYSLITNDKQTIFQPKVTITQKDLEDIPLLKQLREAINLWEEKLKTVEGRDAYIIKRTLIDLRKDQYIIKNAYRRPIILNKITRSKFDIPLNENITINEEDGALHYSGITLTDPAVCSAILCNYSKLKEDSYDNFTGDTWYLIYDFEQVCDAALAAYPMYMRLLEYKIDGLTNAVIQENLEAEFGVRHSVEYISSLWRNKIPNLIAETAQKQYLDWYYTIVAPGTYKKCSRCGQIKLAHNKYFSKNKTSKDGFYSICKECRNKKK